MTRTSARASRRFVKKAEVGQRRSIVHVLRHTFVNLLIQQGESLAYVKSRWATRRFRSRSTSAGAPLIGSIRLPRRCRRRRVYRSGRTVCTTTAMKLSRERSLLQNGPYGSEEDHRPPSWHDRRCRRCQTIVLFARLDGERRVIRAGEQVVRARGKHGHGHCFHPRTRSAGVQRLDGTRRG